MRKFKDKVKAIGRAIVKSAIDEHIINLRVKDIEEQVTLMQNNIELLREPLSLMQNSIESLRRPLNELCPIDLGYYSGNHGQVAVDSKQLLNCKLLGNRYDVLSLLPQNAICAEVGVAYGDFSQKILETMNPEKLYLIDIYSTKPGEPEFWGKDLFLKANMNHEEYIKARFQEEINNDIIQVVKGYSHEVLENFQDDFFDYVYVDGGHSYDCVKKDIEVLKRKVKNGGIIAFNDYTYFTLYENFEYGVFKAVNEFLSEGNHEVIFYCLNSSKMDDIVVKIKK